MKALSKTMVAVGMVGMLAGCSTMPASSGPQAVERNIDMQKVAAVNAAAKKSGLTILWVNPPTKEN
jgi:hypothetical protein